MLEMIKRFVQEEEGQDLVEYALLLVFIALIVIAALPNLGKTVSNVFSKRRASCSQVHSISKFMFIRVQRKTSAGLFFLP